MMDFFDKIDILILPSWEEPFGIVLLEAMAAGIPVIATDRGGPREIVRGVSDPAKDPTALANAIRSIRPGDTSKKRANTSRGILRTACGTMIEEFYIKMGAGGKMGS